MNNVQQIPARNNGFAALAPTNMEQAMQIATMLSKSNMVPASYKGKAEDTLVAMMMGSELGLNPIQSLQNIAVINGRPSIYGDALVALVQNHPAFGGMEEKFDDATMTATCTVWRKGGTRHTQSFGQKDAMRAGLWDERQKVTRTKNGQSQEVRNDAPWFRYPKRMLQMRARGFALRDCFADALAGLITAEEAQDMPPLNEPRQEIDVTPTPQALPYYPAEAFDKNFPAWEAVIKGGKKTAEAVIAMVESKAPLTDEQKQQILQCEGQDQ